KASNHAKMITVATLLARAQLVRLEDELDEKGFPDLDAQRGGTFAEEGFPIFRWDVRIEKIELPSNIGDAAKKAAENRDVEAAATRAGASASGFNPQLSGISGAAGMVMSQFEVIRGAIEQSIRKVTLRVYWPEGRKEESFEVATFITDASKVDVALPGLS